MTNPFSRRVRGFRVIDIAFLAVLLAVALGSYAFKTLAGAQTKDTVGVEAQIDQENRRIRLLKAELAKLENPARLEQRSSEILGLQAIVPSHDLTLADLGRIAHAPAPAASAATFPRVAAPSASQAISGAPVAGPAKSGGEDDDR